MTKKERKVLAGKIMKAMWPIIAASAKKSLALYLEKEISKI